MHNRESDANINVVTMEQQSPALDLLNAFEVTGHGSFSGDGAERAGAKAESSTIFQILEL